MAIKFLRGGDDFNVATAVERSLSETDSFSNGALERIQDQLDKHSRAIAQVVHFLVDTECTRADRIALLDEVVSYRFKMIED